MLSYMICRYLILFITLLLIVFIRVSVGSITYENKKVVLIKKDMHKFYQTIYYFILLFYHLISLKFKIKINDDRKFKFLISQNNFVLLSILLHIFLTFLTAVLFKWPIISDNIT